MVVDPDAPGLDLAGGPVGAEDVAGPGGGGESVGGVVGETQPLVVAVEGQDDEDGAEDLGLDGLAVLRGVGDERRAVVGPGGQVPAGRFAAGDDAGVAAGPFDEGRRRGYGARG